MPIIEGTYYHRYKVGDLVEVMRGGSGLPIKYYEATIISMAAENKCTVRYKSLKDDNDPSEPKVDKKLPSMMLRPSPPSTWMTEFPIGTSVDCFHEDGWILSRVDSRTLGDGGTYMLQLTGPCQYLIVEPSKLRLHKEFEDGRWKYEEFEEQFFTMDW